MRSVGEADGARSGGLREVAVAEAQHDRAAHPVAVAQAAGEPIDDLGEDEVEFVGRARAAAERALRADGPAAPRGVDRARIPQPGQRVQVRAGRLAQQPLGGRGFELGQLPDGADAEPVQLLGGHGTDPPQPFDRQREQERLLPLGFDHEQPVGLADRAGDLGEELGPRDPDRDGQSDLRTNPLTQSHRDLLGRARDASETADLQKRLVDGEPLHERRRIAEDREHVSTGRGVGVHPRRDDHGIRAQVARLPAAHRGAHPTGLRLVARRQHHAAADDDRPAAQRGRVTLLDRGVEGVEIGVQHGRLAPHPALPPIVRPADRRTHRRHGLRVRSPCWRASKPPYPASRVFRTSAAGRIPGDDGVRSGSATP